MRLAPLVACALLLVPAFPAGGASSELVLERAYDTVAFRHERYAQVVDGVRVLDAHRNVAVAKDASFRVEHESLAPPRVAQRAFHLDADAARAAAASAEVEAGDAERVWVRGDRGLVAAWAVRVEDADARPWDVVVDAKTGDVLDRRARFAEQLPEFSVPGRVFRVNPIVALQDEDFRDNRLAVDDPSFAPAYEDVTLDGLQRHLLYTKSMRSERVVVADSALGARPGDDLRFSRDDPRFLEVMVYYYIELALDKMASLGYADPTGGLITVRSHWVPETVAPNAYASTDNSLTFMYRSVGLGRGTTFSSAEDAEVIVHELGHLFHFHALPEWSGTYSVAFGEGTADFYAGALLSPLSGGFGDACVGEWIAAAYEIGDQVFAPRGLPCLRDMDNDYRYPEHVTGSGHTDGQLWSGPLWDIRAQIGNDAALVLVTEAIHVMSPQLDSFSGMGRAVVDADRALTGGAREQLIREAFAAHGIAIA